MEGFSNEILNRKGARKAEDIPSEVLKLLNEGKVQTVNLTEWLAVDQLSLLQLTLKVMGKGELFPSFEEAVFAQKKPTTNSNTKVIGQTFGLLLSSDENISFLEKHESDVVRCWGCWAKSLLVDSIPDLLKTIKIYAADSHFGVREVVIFATKERLSENLEQSVEILKDWTASKDENVRRYVAEVLRPVGVWTKKIAKLQTNPEVGLPLLEPLKSDDSKYVQNSVANWLNDASKSTPEWVRDVCDRWQQESETKATAYIVKRGLRTLNK